MNTFRALWAVIRRYQERGDRWTRFPLFYIVLWPFVLIVVSLTGWLSITSLVALTPAFALLVLLLVSPVLTGALWAADETRLGVKALFALVGVELLAGWYLAVVPLRNDVMLIPFFILTVAAIVLLAVGLGGKFSRAAMALGGTFAVALVISFVVLTGIFIAGGRSGVKEKADSVKAWVSGPEPPRATTASSIPTSQVIEVDSTETEVVIPDHYWAEFAPRERSIEFRLTDGRVFEKTPDGRMLRDDGSTAPRIDVIPGNSVFLQTKGSDSTTTVVVTMRSKTVAWR